TKKLSLLICLLKNRRSNSKIEHKKEGHPKRCPSFDSLYERNPCILGMLAAEDNKTFMLCHNEPTI
ncbi:MAG: hypothetical protein Q3X94_04060, partial [Oscillospiraceae bacterium]|nr:hypothetical protein [Oscillospiraceae bacterium]